MEEPRKRYYILVQDRIGQILERNMLALGLATKSTPTHLLKGELLEALPESEQPGDSTRIALGGIDRKLRLECGMEDVMRLRKEEADLLLPVSSAGLRYQTFIDRKSLDFGKQLVDGSKVFVSLKGFSKNLPGVVWYKGELPNITGTMFGVELHKNPGCGTSDGMFQNIRYFHCAPDSGVFVALDRLIPFEDLTLTSRLEDKVIPSFSKGKHDSESPQERSVALEIDQRIVTFIGNIPMRGTVRYIGDQREQSGRVHTVVGVQLDERRGNGTGKLNGKQLFICRRDYALFVDLETVILEKDFDENLEGASMKTTLHIQGEGHTKGKAQEESQKEEMLTKSMGHDHTKNLGAFSDVQELKDENKRLKHEHVQWEKERKDLLTQQEYLGGELGKVQRAKEEITQQMTNLQTELRAKEDHVRELETTLSTAQQALEEYRQKEACDWIIHRNEVHLSNKHLGVGGWGTVILGSFRGCKVAVKQIHELILSPHNRRLFEREMNIASRCRHPCLLQFIGATNDGESPLFVTELMETSLRALLEQRRLAETEVSVISLDVALALNYLHKNNPPIIHRDISSANVLLWKQGDQWRGKVSDYGTANFMQQTMTVAPGAMIYSAPEALTSNQTDKIDVYSFGVLLCEMCIRELPDPKQREEQVALVTSHMFRTVIRRCLQSDPFARPNMDEMVDHFNSDKHLFESPR